MLVCLDAASSKRRKSSVAGGRDGAEIRTRGPRNAALGPAWPLGSAGGKNNLPYFKDFGSDSSLKYECWLRKALKIALNPCLKQESRNS